MNDFLAESDQHGWPSFRDEEVVWENMRVLRTTGEAVSADGTHLGHNLPDRKGNRCGPHPLRTQPPPHHLAPPPTSLHLNRRAEPIPSGASCAMTQCRSNSTC